MPDDEEIVTIYELCKQLGLTSRTLRYWEEVKIIEAVERNNGASRGYTPYTVRRIKFIMKLKELGLTIKEMQILYAAYGAAKQTEQMIPELLQILQAHLKTIDKKVTNLMLLRKEIAEYSQKIQTRFENKT